MAENLNARPDFNFGDGAPAPVADGPDDPHPMGEPASAPLAPPPMAADPAYQPMAQQPEAQPAAGQAPAQASQSIDKSLNEQQQ